MTTSENIKDRGRVRTVVGAVLFLWLALVFALGVSGTFMREPGVAPLPILYGVLIPIIVFLAADWSSDSFHDFVMSLDLQFAAGVQAWRFAGLGFIALYAYGVLPGMFAWPAGLGDIFIGLTAPWVIITLKRRPDFAASRLFRIWNLLGILDLVVAVCMGGMSAFLGIGLSGAITTFPMARLPLLLIPAFLVPLFIMLHITSLTQSLHLAGECVRDGKRVPCGPAETVSRA